MSDKTAERTLSAITFTDLVGYTSLTQLDESRALESLEKHNRQVRQLIKKFLAREVKTIGDSFLIEFDDALQACRCAIEIQKSFHESNTTVPDPWKIKLRIGIHFGDVIHRESDVLGDTVNIASRIEPLADSEGICISGQVFDQIRNRLGLPIIQLQHMQLKNVTLPITVYKILLPWERGVWSKRGTPHLDKNRIAVLPFTKIGTDEESEFFADGLTEEVISSISKITQLSVVSRTSVMRYKGQTKRLTDIGHELNVGNILEGSIRRSGSRIRSSVQLVDVISDRHIWSEVYDRTLEDVFTIQSQIAQSVATSLELQLRERDRERIESVGTTSTEAYSLYLHGRLYSLRVTQKSYRDSIKLFEQALEKDTGYAQAYAAIAHCYAGLGAWEIIPAREALPKARKYAERALEIDDSIAEAHAALATVLNLQDWKFPEAEKEFRRAIELNPSLSYAHILFSLFLGQFGRSDEAIQESKRAIDLDPLSAETFTIAGVVHLYNGHVEEAKAFLMNAIYLDPNSAFAFDALGCCYVRTGEFEQGISEIKKAIELAGESEPLHLSDLAHAYSKAGKGEEARGVLTKLLDFWKQGKGSPTAIAGAYANIGDNDMAFQWLFKAIEERSGYLFSIVVDFAFENLWRDPRWLEVLKKTGFDRAIRDHDAKASP